jgi:hypothetical protein
MLYLVSANTGLRANELASLTAASFDLEGDPATVTVEAGYSKRRRRDVLPLRADLAVLLCPFLTIFDSRASMTGPDTEAAELRATGTDGRTDQSLVAPRVALEIGLSCPVVSLSDHEGEVGRTAETVKVPVRNAVFAGESGVRLSGLEPETYGLKVRCSTN